MQPRNFLADVNVRNYLTDVNVRNDLNVTVTYVNGRWGHAQHRRG
jgi:hypothetical protein